MPGCEKESPNAGNALDNKNKTCVHIHRLDDLAIGHPARRRILEVLRRACAVLGMKRRKIGRLGGGSAVAALLAALAAAEPAYAGYAEAGNSYQDSAAGVATSGTGNTGGAFGSSDYGVMLAGDNDIVSLAAGRLTYSAANQLAIPGSYTDTVTVTVTY